VFDTETAGRKERRTKMRKKLALLAVGSLLLGAFVLTGCKVAIVRSVDQTCSATGSSTVDVTFNWTPAAVGNGIQYLDLSLYDTFPPGLFLGAGPLPPNQNTYSWPGLLPNKTHYWRVNTLLDGVWYTSATGMFVTLPCGTAPGSSSLIARKGPDGIYVNDGKITDRPGDESPAISPDGGTMAFERCTAGEQGSWGPPCNICLIGVDGTNLRCVAENGIEPRWFPNGSLIAFKSLTPNPNGGWAAGVALYDLSTGTVANLPGTANFFGGFGPSPDGRFLLLGSETRTDALVVDLNGAVVAQFHDEGHYAQGWSQDGRVLFTEGIGGTWDWGNVTDGSISPGSRCRCGQGEGDLIVYAGNYQSRYPWGYTLCEFMGGG
jgi:hypothetical protein